jgi:hypothetical protein
VEPKILAEEKRETAGFHENFLVLFYKREQKIRRNYEKIHMC